MHTNHTEYPECCAELHRKVDRVLDLLEERQTKRKPADGAYRVTIPPASRAWEYWEQRQIAEEWAADEGLEAPPKAPPYAASALIEAPKEQFIRAFRNAIKADGEPASEPGNRRCFDLLR
ncbi:MULTISPECIES: hypothetical protein [Glycomyces]|uniref:Uncharacterized protein n=2 Tax=Glycomyces TaxID=58113 RepID=A0ABU2ALF7_9ACTN|nr:hypothetical protein [Glycomyces lechevalierae]MDR7336813.1 hypothetical protein [Glycomyces lechevalierae]